MRTKKFLASTLVIVFLIQIFMSNFNLAFVKGAEISDFAFITGVTIKDASGNDLGNNIGKSDEIHATYSWEIPNDKAVNVGDTYTMQLPKEIHIISVINQPINDDGGNKIADMRIGTDNSVVMTFTQYASDHSNVSGYFFVDCHFKASEISNLNPVPIEFAITGMATPVTVNVNFDQPDPTVVKDGIYDPANDDITWKVTVNKEGVKADNVNFEDTINVGQDLVDNSVEIDGIPVFYSYDTVSRKLSYDLGNITSQQVITFKTNIHNDLATKVQGNYNYSNTAKINYEDNGIPKAITSNIKTVPVSVKYIGKVGIYDEATKQINWTIKVNETGRTITNAKIVEDIPAGLKVIPGTIKVGDSTADTEVLDGEYSYNYVDNTSTSRLEYSLGDIYGVKTFTFATEVNGNLYNSNNLKVFNNIAYIVGDGIPVNTSSNYGVGVQSNIIQKEGLGYNASTGRITWKITVNKNKTNVAAGAVVTDNIPIGQEYVAGSIKVDGVSIGDSGYVAASPSDSIKTGTVSYTFTNSFSDTHTIELQTQVLNSKQYKANYLGTYNNSANITAVGVNENANGTQNVDSEVIKKTATDYNYATREITWKIVVNRNAMPITNAVINDEIPSGQEYVENSATIDDSSNGLFNSEADIMANNKVVYTFTGAINKTYTITLKTRVIDLTIFNSTGNKTLNNTATISGDEIPTDGARTSIGSRSIQNSVINKRSTYTNGNAYIDWAVETNNNFSIPLVGAKITDILQDGLVLDTDTVELYTLIVKPNGSLTESTKIPLTKDNVFYDPTIRKFVFTFPAGVGTGAHRLKFRTNVTKVGSYTNSVQFSGSAITQNANSSSVGVWFSSGGGGGIGETGSITVVKVDENDNSKKLSGAIFQLLDQYGNVKATSLPTGSTGIVLFNNLKFDLDYYIKEVTAPIGYLVSDEVYKFQLHNVTDQKNITYAFKDQKIKGTIELTKVDEVNNPLKDAEFSIYSSTDTGFLTPLHIVASDISGKVIFNNVPYGTYVIKETKAPVGYNISTVNYAAAIVEDGKIVQATANPIVNTKIKGNIEVYKTSDSGLPLANAELSIYDATDIAGLNPLKTETSAVNGIVSFNNLPYGKYIIKETKAPIGYNLSPQVLSAEISEEGKTVKSNPDTIVNTKIKGNIEFLKTGEDHIGLPGVEFTLYDSLDLSFIKPVKIAVSDNNGIVRFQGIEFGSYVIKETKTPIEYNPIVQIITATISEDGKTVKATPDTIINTKIKGNIKLLKVGEDSKGIEGAEFALYLSTDTTYSTPLMTETSDNTGLVEFKNVPLGNYIVKEIKAPIGYNLSNQVCTAEIIEEGKTIDANPNIVANTKIRGNIEILKVGEDNVALKGVEFTLYDATDTSFSKPLLLEVSDDTGVVKFNNIPYGSYIIKETKTIAGFNLSNDIAKVAITEDGKIVKATPDTVINTKIKGNIELLKTGEDGTGIQGAEFTLYADSDVSYLKPIDVAISDASGVARFDNVLYGSYRIKETKAPTGYNLSSQIVIAEIIQDGQTVKTTPNTITNTRIRGNIELLKDGEDNVALKGVEFTLYDAKDLNFLKPILVAVSDDTGVVRFSGVPYGTYTIRETKTVTGYALSTESIAVAIIEEGTTVKTNPYTIINTKIRGTIVINKIDDNGNAVEGAEFAVYDATDTKYQNPLMTAVSNAKGKIVFKGLVYGNYVVKEIKAPYGYKLSTDILEIFVKENGAVYSHDIRNAKILVSIEVKAVDKSGKILSNTEFIIYDKNGNPIGLAKSDDKGIVKFDNVGYGEYIIKQTKGTNGYIISSEEIPVSISSAEPHSLVVENQKTVITDVKPDGDTKLNGNVETNETSIIEGLPKTGAYFDFIGLLMIGAINVFMGTIFILRRKN